MRKSIVSMLAAGVALSLAACGSTGAPATTPAAPGSAAPTAASTADAGSLTIWVDETRIDTFTEIGKEFTAESGVALDVVQKPNSDLKDDFVAQAPSGQGPDLVVGANDWTGDLVSNGLVAPIELGDALGDIADGAKSGFTLDGQLYGVPYAVENLGLVRNNGIVKDTPATFDEVVAQAKEAGAEFPVLIQQAETGDAYHLYPLQTSFGAQVFKDAPDGGYTAELGMGGAEGEAFATYLKKLTDEGVLNASIGADQAKQAFIDGKSPYMVTGPWNIEAFQEAGLDVAVLPIPSAGGQPSAPFLGVQGVFLSSKSEQGLLANQFLDYVATKDVQEKLFELGGRIPAIDGAADSIDDPILKGFAEAGKDGKAMPAIPQMAAVWNHWGGAEISIINGQASDPVAAWKTMIENITAEL